jgi:hypothetical protein
MKMVSLLILVLYLLLPLACFAHPCDSCLDNPDTADSSGKSGSHSHSQDADSCDTTICCEEYINLSSEITIIYAPLVSAIVTHECYQRLPKVVIPIFVPPQSLA